MKGFGYHADRIFLGPVEINIVVDRPIAEIARHPADGDQGDVHPLG